jgi:hypothetical protein
VETFRGYKILDKWTSTGICKAHSAVQLVLIAEILDRKPTEVIEREAI